MTYLYLLSLLTLVAYIGYALKVCGLPASLSDTYYILKDKHRPSWLFHFDDGETFLDSLIVSGSECKKGRIDVEDYLRE